MWKFWGTQNRTHWGHWMKQHFRIRKKRDKGNVGAGYRVSGK